MAILPFKRADLTQINLTIDEERRYEIDHWASLLKAIKWKDVKAPMDTNLTIKKAATVSYQLTQEK